MATEAKIVPVLRVDVIQGRYLAAKDRNGFSDPYCKLCLEDENQKRDRETQRTTQIIPKTLDPEWNATFSFILLAKHKNLVIRCMDKDKFSSCFLGEFIIPLATIEPGEKWIPLQQKRGKKKAKISGELLINLSIEGVPKSKTLMNHESASRVLNKLFRLSLGHQDIFCEIACTSIRKKSLFGTLVACAGALYFFTDREKGNRTAMNFSWWDITSLRVSRDTITVEIASQKKESPFLFQDLIDPCGSKSKLIQSTWNKQKKVAEPEKRRRSRGTLLTKKSSGSSIKRVKEKSIRKGGDYACIDEYTDNGTDFSEMSAGSDGEDFEDDPFLEEADFPDLDLAVEHQEVACNIHFFAKRGVVDKEGKVSLFLKIQDLRDSKTTSMHGMSVEVRLLSELFLFETKGEEGLINADILTTYDPEVVKKILFSVYQGDDFIGETEMKLSSTTFPASQLVTLTKKVFSNRIHSRRLLCYDTKLMVSSPGRVEMASVYQKKKLSISLHKYISYADVTYEKLRITAIVPSSSSGTFQADKLVETTRFVDVNESFEFKSVPKGASLLLVFATGSGTVFGKLVLPVLQLRDRTGWIEVAGQKEMQKLNRSVSALRMKSLTTKDDVIEPIVLKSEVKESSKSSSSKVLMLSVVLSLFVLLLAIFYMFLM